MPNLGDFLGHLMSEITIARMQADVEAIRIAELYASHPLLAQLPVPHFRLPNIEIDVPVIVKGMEEPQPGLADRGAPTIEDMKVKFKEVLTKFIKDESIELKPATKKKLDQSIEKKFTEFSHYRGVASIINHVADTLSKTVSSTISGMEEFDKLKKDKLSESIKNISRIEFLKLSKPMPRLQVLVTTAEIRSAGPTDIITRIHLKVNEEAFEWTSIESEGQRKDRLVPE